MEKPNILQLENGRIQPNSTLTAVVYDLLNCGFYVKINLHDNAINANRWGKKGEVKVRLMATQIIITQKNKPSQIVDYDNYFNLIKSQIIG